MMMLENLEIWIINVPPQVAATASANPLYAAIEEWVR